MHLELYLLDQAQETSRQFVKRYVELIAEIEEQVGRLSEPQCDVVGCSRVVVHVLALAKEVMLIGQLNDPNGLVDPT